MRNKMRKIKVMLIEKHKKIEPIVLKDLHKKIKISREFLDLYFILYMYSKRTHVQAYQNIIF